MKLRVVYEDNLTDVANFSIILGNCEKLEHFIGKDTYKKLEHFSLIKNDIEELKELELILSDKSNYIQGNLILNDDKLKILILSILNIESQYKNSSKELKTIIIDLLKILHSNESVKVRNNSLGEFLEGIDIQNKIKTTYEDINEKIKSLEGILNGIESIEPNNFTIYLGDYSGQQKVFLKNVLSNLIADDKTKLIGTSGKTEIFKVSKLNVKK